MRIEVAALTDVGKVRDNNEDSIGMKWGTENSHRRKKGDIFVVCDGMGGIEAGEVASRMAVKDIISEYLGMDGGTDIGEHLKTAIASVNDRIFKKAQTESEHKGMGCTVTAAVLIDSKAIIANVGDSRAYLIRKKGIRQITQDHSWVAEQIRNSIITQEQAKTHPYRNVITRCLGTSETVEVDVFNRPLQKKDAMLLCSDGLHALVTDEEIRSIVGANTPNIACRRLVELANGRGGTDNISVIVLKVGGNAPRTVSEETVRVGPTKDRKRFTLKKLLKRRSQ